MANYNQRLMNNEGLYPNLAPTQPQYNYQPIVETSGVQVHPVEHAHPQKKTKKKRGLVCRMVRRFCVLCSGMHLACCSLGIVFVIVAIVVGIVAGVAVAQCSKPQVTHDWELNVDWSKVQSISIISKYFIDSTVKVLHVADGFNGSAIVGSYSAVSRDYADHIPAATANIDSELLTVAVNPSDGSWFGLASLFACEKASFTLNVPKSVIQSTKVKVKADIFPAGGFDIIGPANLSNVEATILSGHAKVSEGLSVGSFTTKLTNGNIELRNAVVAETFDVQTSNGWISANSVAVRNKAQFKTLNGNVKIQNLDTLTAAITLSTDNGDVETTLSTRFRGSYSMDTKRGAANLNCNVCASTSDERSHKSGSIRGMGGSIDMSSKNGDVSLTVLS